MRRRLYILQLIILCSMLFPYSAGAVSYTYDLVGNRITMTDPTGTTHYEYDALNRVTKITNPNGEITTYTYDAVGRRTSTTLHNGIVTSYQYDAAGRLLDLVHQLNAATVATFSYTYDVVGNRTSMTDEYGVHNYAYDALYRLLEASHPQPNNPLEQFNYDAVGNRTGNVYNTANQLLEDDSFIYSYDRNGNTIEKVSKADNSGIRYYWNAENQLMKIEEYSDITSNSTLVSVSSYIYDGFGRRVAKNVDGMVTKYLYDQEDILLEMDVNDTISARYTHGPGIDEPISMERSGSSYYYVTDGLGSIVKLVDAAGNMVNNYVYDSFGNMVEKTEGVANPYTYTAREYDAESGLYYYRARYYDAKIGRFISEDPIGFFGGINFYRYVGNNPLNWIDPFGFDSWKYNKDTQMFYLLDDNKNIIDTWPAVSGPWGKGSLPPGSYDTGDPIAVTGNPFCDNSGHCWWVRITPNFPDSNREGLGVHPDGNKPGTEGCIGIQCKNTEDLWRIFNEQPNLPLEVVEGLDVPEAEDGSCGQ